MSKMHRVYALVVVFIALGVVNTRAAQLRLSTLSVISDPPGASVVLDAKPTGRVTPCTFKGVRPGKHSVSCSLSGYHDVSITSQLRPGASAKVALSLKPVLTTGFLKLESTPDAVPVWLDGVDTGKVTPTTLEKLQPGEHIVELRCEGYKKWQQQFSVKAEETAFFSSTLTKIPAFVLVCKRERELDGASLVAVNLSDGAERRITVIPDNSHAFAISPSGKNIAVAVNTYGGFSESGRNPNGLLFLDYRGAIIGKANTVDPFREKIAWEDYFPPRVVDIEWAPCGPDRILMTIQYRYNRMRSMFIAEYDLGSSSLHILSPMKKIEIQGRPSDILDGVNTGPLRDFPVYEDRGPTYSPDAKRIAFLRNGEVYVANSDLSEAKLLSGKIETRDSPFVPPLRWSPDGNRILCCRDSAAVILRLDGTIEDTISGVRPGACWVPDGTGIVTLRSDKGLPLESPLSVYEFANGNWKDFASNFMDVAELDPGWHRALGAGMLVEPSTKEGKLTVESKVGQAKIYIDGELTGELTPHTFTLSPGIHEVRIETVDGEHSGKTSATLLPEEDRTLTFN